MPKISVIIPIYKVEDYIEKSIVSISKQTFKDYEVILVDDESPDKSAEIAKRILSRENVSYKYYWKKNGGLADARQYGIDHSSGEWVAFLDSDDVVDPHFLEVLYDMVYQYDTNVSVVSYSTTKELGSYAPTYDNSIQPKVIDRETILHSFLIRKYKPIFPAFLIRRSFIQENAISSALHCRFSEDDYYMWQVFFKCDRVAVSEMKLYYYIQRDSSISHSSSADKIMTGYNAFVQLLRDHEEWYGIFEGTKYIFPRWVLGALRSAAAMSRYDIFLDIAKRMHYKQHISDLRGFPEIKACILSKVLLVSPMLFYKIVRRFG